MKKRYLAAGTALGAALWLLATSASAHELEAAVASSYIDTATFNTRFSENPVIQLTATIDLSDTIYFAPYVYLDPDDPMEGESSEYGFEVGGEWTIGGCASAELAAGHWANYNGLGADVNDTFVRIGLSCAGASLAVVSLWGETDDTIVHAGYELGLGEALTVTPSLAYMVDAETLSPAIQLDYAFSEHVTVSGQIIYPEIEDEFGEVERELYGAVRLAWVWGSE